MAGAACTIVGSFVLADSMAIADETTWQTMLATGDNQLSQQKLVEAEACFRQAVKDVQHARHNQDDVVKCLEKLASILTQENKIDEAVPLYERSLHILESTYGEKSAKLVPTLFSLGSIYESEGDPKVAMKLYQRALAINEKSYGSFSPAVADSLHFLGRAHSKLGQTQQAEHEYKTSLSILMQQPGLSSSTKLQSLLADYHDFLRKNDNTDSKLISDFQTEVLKDKLGPVKETRSLPPSAWQKTTRTQPSNNNEQNQLAPTGSTPTSTWQKQISAQPATGTGMEALPSGENAIALRGISSPSDWQKQTLAQAAKANDLQNDREQQIVMRGFQQPFNDTTLAPAYDTMTNTIHNQYGYPEGEDRYKRMIALDIKVLGPHHPAVADDLSALALLYISQQKYSLAKPLLIRASSIYESVYGRDNLLYKRTRESLASVLNKLGDTKEAIAVCTDTLNQGRTVLDHPNGLETARILNELGFLYYRQGKLEDACTIYKWALASTEGALGDENVLVAACLTDYANVLRSLGRMTEADAMQERACRILEKQS